MHIEYSVILEIVGPDLRPDAITRSIGIVPTDSWERGDEHVTGKRQEGVWKYCVYGETPIQLGDTIDQLMEVFARKHDVLKELAMQYECAVSCMVLASNDVGWCNLRVSHGTVSLLSKLNLSLEICIPYN